jgi:hypothetical protein
MARRPRWQIRGGTREAPQIRLRKAAGGGIARLPRTYPRASALRPSPPPMPLSKKTCGLRSAKSARRATSSNPPTPVRQGRAPLRTTRAAFRKEFYFLGQLWPRDPEDADGAAQQCRCPVDFFFSPAKKNAPPGHASPAWMAANPSSRFMTANAPPHLASKPPIFSGGAQRPAAGREAALRVVQGLFEPGPFPAASFADPSTAVSRDHTQNIYPQNTSSNDT